MNFVEEKLKESFILEIGTGMLVLLAFAQRPCFSITFICSYLIIYRNCVISCTSMLPMLKNTEPFILTQITMIQSDKRITKHSIFSGIFAVTKTPPDMHVMITVARILKIIKLVYMLGILKTIKFLNIPSYS